MRYEGEILLVLQIGYARWRALHEQQDFSLVPWFEITTGQNKKRPPITRRPFLIIKEF
jgi:hypothetical protein